MPRTIDDTELIYALKERIGLPQLFVGRSEAEDFVKVKGIAETLGIKGYYIFYSTSGFTADAEGILCQNGIMYADNKTWDLS